MLIIKIKILIILISLIYLEFKKVKKKNFRIINFFKYQIKIIFQ